MNSTFITLVMRTVQDVYTLFSLLYQLVLLHTCNLYNDILFESTNQFIQCTLSL